MSNIFYIIFKYKKDTLSVSFAVSLFWLSNFNFIGFQRVNQQILQRFLMFLNKVSCWEAEDLISILLF